MRRLWTDLESVAVGTAATRLARMTPPAGQTLLDDLRELVAALDRRVPRLEREGERAIARDAAALRDEAMKRITELERAHAAPGTAPAARPPTA
jgi:hypothetical protein